MLAQHKVLQLLEIATLILFCTLGEAEVQALATMADTSPLVTKAAVGDTTAVTCTAYVEDLAAAGSQDEDQQAATTDAALGQPSGMYKLGAASNIDCPLKGSRHRSFCHMLSCQVFKHSTTAHDDLLCMVQGTQELTLFSDFVALLVYCA